VSYLSVSFVVLKVFKFLVNNSAGLVGEMKGAFAHISQRIETELFPREEEEQGEEEQQELEAQQPQSQDGSAMLEHLQRIEQLVRGLYKEQQQ